MRCSEVVDHLAGVADGTAELDEPARRHVATCLRCQAEIVQYRKLLRALRAMRTEVLDPGPGLVSDILAALEEAGERQAVRGMLSGRRVAYMGGIAAATAAGAAGAFVIATLSRRGRVRLAS